MKRITIAIGVLLTFAAGVTANSVYQSRYEGLNWHCGEWEAEWKVTPGGHSAIVMFAERPETETQNRKICYATLQSDEANFQVLEAQ